MEQNPLKLETVPDYVSPKSSSRKSKKTPQKPKNAIDRMYYSIVDSKLHEVQQITEQDMLSVKLTDVLTLKIN